MPTYVYNCKNCYYFFEENIKYEDRDAPTEELCDKCKIGKIIRIPVMPGFAYDNIGPNKKPDQGFNDRLKDIKRSHRGSNINIYD